VGRIMSTVAAVAVGTMLAVGGLSAPAQAAVPAPDATLGASAAVDGPVGPQRIVAQGDGWVITTDAETLPQP
jgi:hypothetical protein